MDKYLKERLVGAAVLVAAAIILIPEMLSGPKDNVPVQMELPAHDDADGNGLKTYTIDLNASQGAAPQALSKEVEHLPAELPAIAETKPPPPEIPADATSKSAQNAVAQKSGDPQGGIERDQRLIEEFSAPQKQVKPVVKPDEKSAQAETPAPIKNESEKATQQAVPGGWSVQVASFGVRATSERVAADLKAKGYPAFVMSFASKGQTMYRVRVGPVADRAAAETLLKKIKPLHPGANVAAP